MSILPSASANSLNSALNPSEISNNKEARREREQKASNVGIGKILMSGLTICKKEQDLCELPSPCYRHIGVGTIISGTNNKAYILTVAHLFSHESTEYFLLKNEEPLFPFKYANPKELPTEDIALIPIGEVDPEAQQLRLSVNKSADREVHFHL